MDKNRLEAFSDGVIAVIITILVLELKAPQGDTLDALMAVLPAFVGYVLSFIYVGIYWNNHHHIFHVVQRINGITLWANLHLLFWLSLIPFVTWWMSGSHFSTWPVIAYGVILLMSAIAWEIERQILLQQHDQNSTLAKALQGNFKEWISVAIYAVAIGLAFFNPYVSCTLYGLVAGIWFLPDRRIERCIKH